MVYIPSIDYSRFFFYVAHFAVGYRGCHILFEFGYLFELERFGRSGSVSSAARQVDAAGAVSLYFIPLQAAGSISNTAVGL